jgi:phage terminase large subunit-like protein
LSPATTDELSRGDGILVREFLGAKAKITKDSIAGPAGAPLVLRGWQSALVDHAFARRADGRRKHRIMYAGLPRKSGKSALAAGIALYGLVMEGQGMEVFSCAADKDQSRLVFGAAKRMVEMDEELSTRLKLYRDAIEDTVSGSVYRALSSEAFTKEGLSPTLVVYDELHAAPNRELFDVMSLAMGARSEPMLLAITTAGAKSDTTGKDSIAYTMYQYGLQVAKGEVKDPSFGFAWWEAPDGADHRDPKTWAVANPGLGDISDQEDFASALLRTPEAEFRTKRLNIWTSGTTSWLPAGSWAARAVPRKIQPGESVVLSFDGAFTNDCTAICGVTLDGHVELLAIWERRLDDPHYEVPIDEVEEKMRELCRTYDVLEVAADPYRWARTLQAWESEGIPVVVYPQNPARMVPACALFMSAVTQGELTHDGNPILERHLDNTTVKLDRWGPRIVKEHKGSPRKIDAAVCAVMAYDRSRYHATVGKADTVSVEMF